MSYIKSVVSKLRVAVLYQALPPPVVNGVVKPPKPGGYQDSGADIAYNLREHSLASVVTPKADPKPAEHEGWCFPDTEDGILSAIKNGANCLWANTILFKEHPLQVSEKLSQPSPDLKVIGQPPLLVQAYDDKDFVGRLLQRENRFNIPKAFTASPNDDVEALLGRHTMEPPVVVKPIRGRGSQGVKVCKTLDAVKRHLEELKSRSIVEEFLSGVEGTVTVMPPSASNSDYWALPIVLRYNHDDGIAPYNGIVAVTANSKVVTPAEAVSDPTIAEAQRQCENVARLLKPTAPIRIDVRKRNDKAGSLFALFDINMKPNMTVPGRPGREEQASLTAMAAAGLGWTPVDLLEHMLVGAVDLNTMRTIRLPE